MIISVLPKSLFSVHVTVPTRDKKLAKWAIVFIITTQTKSY